MHPCHDSGVTRVVPPLSKSLIVFLRIAIDEPLPSKYHSKRLKKQKEKGKDAPHTRAVGGCTPQSDASGPPSMRVRARQEPAVSWLALDPTGTKKSEGMHTGNIGHRRKKHAAVYS